MKIGSGKPVVGATLVVARSRHQPVFIPLMWPLQGHGDCYENRLRQTCCRGNPCGCPFPAPTRFHPLMWPLQGHGDCYENRLRQTCCRGNPCGCPFPAPTRFHPLMWPLQGHGDSYENRFRQTCCRGNPCGCPFPAPTRFHPLCGLCKAMVIPSSARNLRYPAVVSEAVPPSGLRLNSEYFGFLTALRCVRNERGLCRAFPAVLSGKPAENGTPVIAAAL